MMWESLLIINGEGRGPLMTPMGFSEGLMIFKFNCSIESTNVKKKVCDLKVVVMNREGREGYIYNVIMFSQQF